jgi:UDP-4-amino-4,6-dideoxy-N-acetyl-beta-L-altrosamine transaminase
MIPYGRQSLSEDDVRAVVEVLRSDWLTQGPLVDRFEKTVAEYCRAGDAVAVSNGTAALHLACLALDLGPGDWLWTVPNSFVASANCGIYCGASVDFVDIDPRTYNMDVEALEAKLRSATDTGRLPKVVVPVHFSGHPCSMERIGELSRRYGFRVVEDATHAIGSTYCGQPVGACTHSDLVVFSFHPVKIVTTGEGGMVATNDADLAAKLRQLRHHGVTRDKEQMAQEVDGPWYYEQTALGFNYRITDMQCALGVSQMQRLEEFVTRRNELARRYEERLAGLPLEWQAAPEGGRSAFHLFVVNLDAAIRRDVFIKMREGGIGVNVHYIPIHLHPFYRGRGFGPGDFPAAEAYYSRALTLPLFPALTEAEQDEVIGRLTAALG